MNSTLSTLSLSLASPKPSHFTKPKPALRSLRITASKNTASPILQTLKNIAVSTVFLTTALSFSKATARADQEPILVPTTVTQVAEIEEFEALKHDEEAMLKMVQRVVEDNPSGIEWKFVEARLLGQMGQSQNSRKVYEEILEIEPFLIEALFENVLMMDKCGESGEAVIGFLQEVMSKEAGKEGGGKDERLMTGLVRFVEKDFDAALECFREVSDEDPGDYRSYFCRGVVCSVLGRDEEAEELFGKYWELLPRNGEVEGLVKFPFGVMKAAAEN